MAWNSYPSSKITEDSVWNVKDAKSPTSYALQYELRRTGYYTGLMDGDFGVLSIQAWQKYLRDKGRYEGKYTGLIDGVVGDMTLYAAASFLRAGGSVYMPKDRNFYLPPSNWGWPTTFPDYNLSLAWQKYLNYRR